MFELKKKKILVTGALGHIGSRLIREFDPSLVEEVILVDNFYTQRYASLFDLSQHLNYEFYERDVRNDDLSAFISRADAVIHLAALTDAASSHGKDADYKSVNVEGLRRVADACLEVGVPILLPSTTSVYGSQESLVDETCPELRPQSPYAASKLEAEEYIRSLGKKGLKGVICRLGTIFGYSIGMRFHTAVNKFIWQGTLGESVTVWKTAWKQKRPYLYLGDCLRAINFILEKNLFDGETYNILTQNLTVEDIVETIKEFAPDLKIAYVDSPIMNQLSYEVDDNKIKKLGFLPQGNLKSGIKETMEKLQGIKH